MGSKNRIAKELLPIILKERKPGQWYVEPFVGGANMIDKVDGKRIGCDSNEYLIAMWEALQRGWDPPQFIDEELYNSIKKNKDEYPKELVGFTGIAVTFGSKWFGTYARNKRGTNYAMEGRGNLKKQINKLSGVVFKHCSYETISPIENCIIYCDPPYEGTSGYKDKFDHVKFWDKVREWIKEGHKVFISEYSAPDDFICVWQKELNTNLDASIMKTRTEKLFIHKSQL